MWGNLAKDKKECVELGSIAWDVLGVRCVFVCWNGWMSEWKGVAEPLSDSSWHRLVPQECSDLRLLKPFDHSFYGWRRLCRFFEVDESFIGQSFVYPQCKDVHLSQFSSLLNICIFHFTSLRL